ncbi:hypothetical protein A9Q81_03310 [Gammaproteobacteria bacterium 42_54_T18]|nr:hypothetical protein A9Q81_03310 [Gammaproteobacteria bacterium 42_54_T18]
MAESHDYQALEWVKSEIEETLKQAQQSLEAYVENSEDSTRMRFCLTHLHQVYGTLQMVEFYGAALLAEEMENLAQALLNGTAAHVGDSQEVLMRAMLQLPAYLDRVKAGKRDMPVVILPLLNDLRAARGESLLSETALFKPNMQSGEKAAPKEKISEEVINKLPQLLKKVRQLYQFALVGLIRNQDMATNLGYLAKSLAKLEQLYSNAPMAQLWWVGGAVVEGVSRSSIELGTSVKMLLGLLDRQIKDNIESGANRMEPVPVELLKNLLYYVARCEGDSPKVKEVKKAFRLDEALPSDDLIDVERQQLAGPDKEAIASVIKALLEEMVVIKENLDIFLRGQSQEIEELKPLVPSLKQVADTLGVLGIGNPRRVILEQIDVIGRVVESGFMPDDNTFMDVAGALLYVEATLQGIAEDGARGAFDSGDNQADNDNYVSPEHVHKARSAVIEESRAGLESAKDAITEYIGSNYNNEYLEAVPEILHSVRGGLAMVPLHHPAALLQGCVSFIQNDLIDTGIRPDWKVLDTLADAITSIEYYLERLGEQFPGDEDILSIAEDAVASLGYPVERVDEFAASVGGTEKESEDIVTLDQVDFDEDVPELEIPELSQVADGSESLEHVSDVESEVPVLDSVTENIVEDIEETSSVEDVAEVSEEPGAEEVEDDDDLIDDEILEIFVEEAEEVLETIVEFTPKWKADRDAEEPRAEVRRAYHTIKGSGRMVGATVIGELGWSIENMLNRVLDGNIEASDDVFLIMETVTSIIPELVKDFESRRKPTLNVDALAAVADALSKGEQPPPIPSNLYISEEPVLEVSEEEAIEEEVEIVEEIAPTDDIEPLATMDDIESIEVKGMLVAEDVIDPVLLDIFSQEARSHLDVVREFLQLAEQSPQSFTSPLLRALHTLKGSAHMAGIHVIADLASPTEKFIKECHLQGLETDAEIHQFLVLAVDLIERGVEQLTTTPTTTIEGTEAFIERAVELRQRKLVHAEEAENADDMGAPDPQLVSIFLAEGTDLILDAADVLNNWEQNPVPGEDLDNLRRELRILSRSASAAQLNDVVALCMALEETYNAMSEGMLTPGAEFFEIAHRAHEHLIGMMDRIAVGQKPMGVDTLVGELQSLVDQAPEVAEQIKAEALEEVATEEDKGESLEGSEEAVEDEASEFEFDTEAETSSLEYEEIDELDELESPEETIPTVSEEEEEEYDAELVEIFLEEAEEIVESISNLLEEWRAEPDNLDKVAQLQRDLHTLKGGARMSDMTEIGDLAHHLENLYEGLCDKKFVAIPSLFSILNECHDTLAVMVEALQAGQPLTAADGLIQQVEAYMAGDTEFVSTVSNVTAEMVSEDSTAISAGVEAANEPELVQQDENALEALSSDEDGEEIDIEILEVFMEEAGELIEGLDTSVSALQDERDSQEHIDELKRLLHTFKGGARLAGLKLLGDISHDFETFLIEQEALIEQEERTEGFDDASLSTIQAYQDKLIEQVDLVRQRGSELLEEATLPGQVSEDKHEPPREVTGEDNVVPITPQPEPGGTIIIQDAVAGSVASKRDSAEKSGSGESVRVSADLIEELVNLSGETSIIRGRVEQELTDFSYEIEDIGMAIDRARELLRRLDIETETQILHGHQTAVGESSDYADFDPLEMDRYSTLHQLSRSLSETASDLMDLKDSLLDRARDTETLLQQQARVNSELQEGLMRTRMVPFSRMVPRLRRIVRQIAGEVGKKAELEVIGADGEMDRTVMDRMISPLEHMIRNAVDHGIETPEERKARGKEETGRITIHLAREGGDVVLRLMDDGKGINLEAVKTRAIERGLMKANAPLSEKEIMQFIFKAGFSTAEKVTQISGRGVGMDVVHSEIKQLGGNLKIHSAPNAGSQFTVRLPFTVSVNRALMVRVGDDAYAIPLNNIEGIVRVSPYELDAYYQPDSPDFEYAGQSYRLRYLGGYVHGTQSPDLQSHVKPLPVLLVRGGDHAVALQVDSLVGSREIVVKSVGPQLSAVSGISGATILGDGSVVIILDLNAMIRADHAQLSIDGKQDVIEEVPVETTPTVMVIDDSVTVRKVTTRLLERHGFDVITAKDGVDAITQLQDIKPDIMLLDIEMPRMDGFEVATLVRHDERLKDTPIIMITSRTGEKHRERAVSIGVNGYMGKPYQETTLLKEIEALVKRPS